MVTHQHDLLVEAADVRVAPRALRIKPPFEHGARDVQRARDDAVALAVDLSANVDEKRALLCGGMRVHRLEPGDLCSSSIKQLVEGSPVGVKARPGSSVGRYGLVQSSRVPPQTLGLKALRVAPRAPNFWALRRVSSNLDLAYVSTSWPVSIRSKPWPSRSLAYAASSSAPAIQPVQRSMLRRPSALTGFWIVTSATCMPPAVKRVRGRAL